MNTLDGSSSSFEAFVNQDMLEHNNLKSNLGSNDDGSIIERDIPNTTDSPPSWTSNHIDEASWNAFCLLASSTSNPIATRNSNSFHLDNASFIVNGSPCYETGFEMKSRTSLKTTLSNPRKPVSVLKIAPNPKPSEPEIYVPMSKIIPTHVKVEITSPVLSPVHEPEYARQTAMLKRQERLIKNRAAALQSRKRKREQMLFLESENLRLNAENVAFKLRIKELESRVMSLASSPSLYSCDVLPEESLSNDLSPSFQQEKGDILNCIAKDLISSPKA